MRTIKSVGLAVVGILALAAMFGASSASASHLCKKATNGCKEENRWPVGTEFTANARNVHFALPLSTEYCGQSTLNAKVTNNGGGLGVPAELEVTKVSFSECNSIWTMLRGGSLSVIMGGQAYGDGIVDTNGMELQRKYSFETCLFEGWRRGAGEKESENAILHGGATPYLTVQNVWMPKISGACGEMHLESANYEVTSPSPVYVTLE